MPYNTDDFARSLPPMKFLQRAGEGGDYILQLLQKALGQNAPKDDLLQRRGKMSEPEYRAWLMKQGEMGQQMSDQSKPLQAPSPK
jgi:hypothetical protein